MSKRICVFGSSIAHGHSDAVGGGWCDRLKKEYFKKGEYSVYNLGISGDTSENVLKRFELECEVRHPQVVLIAIGMNDSLFDQSIDSDWVEIKETAKNLQKIVDITKYNETEIVFIGLTKINEKLLSPVPWAKNLSYSTDSVEKYDEVIKRVAEKNNLPYCSMQNLLEDKDLPDGLHPNAEGHKKMFLRIKDFLVKEGIVG